jgi:hypothetical protein
MNVDGISCFFVSAQHQRQLIRSTQLTQPSHAPGKDKIKLGCSVETIGFHLLTIYQSISLCFVVVVLCPRDWGCWICGLHEIEMLKSCILGLS